jgi:hypothetical protein
MLASGCEWARISRARVAEGALWFSFVPGYNVTGALQRAVIHPWQPELCDLLGFHHRLQDLNNQRHKDQTQDWDSGVF